MYASARYFTSLVYSKMYIVSFALAVKLLTIKSVDQSKRALLRQTTAEGSVEACNFFCVFYGCSTWKFCEAKINPEARLVLLLLRGL